MVQKSKKGYDIGFDNAMQGFIEEILGKEEPEEKKTLIEKFEGLLEEVLPWIKRNNLACPFISRSHTATGNRLRKRHKRRRNKTKTC